MVAPAVGAGKRPAAGNRGAARSSRPPGFPPPRIGGFDHEPMRNPVLAAVPAGDDEPIPGSRKGCRGLRRRCHIGQIAHRQAEPCWPAQAAPARELRSETRDGRASRVCSNGRHDRGHHWPGCGSPRRQATRQVGKPTTTVPSGCRLPSARRTPIQPPFRSAAGNVVNAAGQWGREHFVARRRVVDHPAVDDPPGSRVGARRLKKPTPRATSGC